MEILPDAMDDALTETLRHATKRKMDRLKKALKLPKLPIGAKRKSINASKITESVFYGKVEDVKKLAQEYAHEKETFNRIALHCACQHGKVAVVRFLVENKADLNACDDYNRSALMKAVEHQRESCVRILLGSGADINHVDSDGRTALHLAVAKKSMRIVELLIKKKADIHAKDKNGHTPLVLAVLDGQYEVVKYLIEKGADVDVRDQQLRTPLMLAVVGGCQKTWQLLLDSGADRTLKDISGQTADDYIADLPKFLSVKKPASQESSNTSTRSSKRNTESKKRSTKNKECDNSCEVQEGLFGGLASDSDELTTREVMKDMEKKKELKSFKWTNPDSDHCSSDIMEFKPVPHQQKLPEEMLEIDLGSDEKSVVESEPQEPDSSSLEEDEFTLKCPEGLQSLVPQKNISQDPINKMKQPNLSPDVEASIQKKKSSPPPLQTKFQPKVRSTKVPLKQEEDKPRSGTKMDQTREDQRKVDKNQQSKIQIPKVSEKEKMLQQIALQKDQLEALKAELESSQANSLLKEQGLMEEIEALKQQMAVSSQKKKMRLQEIALQKDQLEALKAELESSQANSLLKEQGLVEEIEALKQQMAMSSQKKKMRLQQIALQKDQLEALKAELESSQANSLLKEQGLMEEIEALKQQIAKPSDREKMLQKNSLEKDQLEALKAELDSLQVNSFLTEQGLMEAIEALKQQIAEPSDREKKLLQRNTSLQQQVTSLEIKLKDSKSSRGLKENQLVEENEALKKQLETVAAELTQEQKTRHLLETEVKSSQTCLSEVIQEAERSKAAQEDREKSLLKEMDEHKQLTAEAASLRESVRSLSQQLISAEERATSLEKEIHHLTQQLSEKDLLLDTLQQDKDQAAASVKELEKAQRELVSAPKEAVNKLLTQAQREYQLLWQHLEIAQEKIDELQRNLKKKTSQCSHLQEENKLLEDELASLKNKSNRIEQLENKVRNLEDELASPKNMSHRIEQLENKLSKLEDELLVLRSQAEAANREKDQMTQYCSDLKEKARKTIQKKEDQISLLKSQAAARQSPNPQNTMYLQLSKKNRELEGGSASPKNVSFRKEQLEKKLSKLEVELLVLKSQAEAANREKDQMTQYCRDLKEKIWKTIQKKEDQINLLKSQAAAQQSLNPQNPVHLQLSKNTELEDATFNGYTTYEELLKQRDSARAEVAQVKEVYSQEMQVRLAAANQIDSLGLQLGELAHEVQRMVAAGTSNMKKS
ncbi:ankyrin repeat domain-containing protein 62-like isoform X7 [Thalassophryne amazonica]|uniref:ankyrin repeat domain-containing protein 62-like isoform X7 n=1 Tax=Thalassophryne amazonica TaxID=390379 RepID=UPI001470AE1C|nr:ankyrin repeat domain-containing protein 62-like isoform X7 [Thalassophryne amazonica]